MTALLALGCYCSRAPAQTEGAPYVSGKVVGAPDGDTLTVLVGSKRFTVRFPSIDAPELGQPFGTQAQDTLLRAVLGQTVTVFWTGQSRDGRRLGFVFKDGTRIESLMVRSGAAWYDRQRAPHEAALARYENEARRARRGLWAVGGAVAPWVWRQSQASQGQANTRGQTGAIPFKSANRGSVNRQRTATPRTETPRTDSQNTNPPIANHNKPRRAARTRAVALVKSAETMFYRGSYARTQALCEAAVRTDATYVRAYTWLGAALEKQERQAEAKTAYEQVLRIAPLSPDANLARQRLSTLRAETERN